MTITKQEWEIGDCLEVMQEYPDNYFDLILTDPPYGIDAANYDIGGTQHGNSKAECKIYGKKDWDKERLDKKYFDEMLRVSKNQIIFGGNYYTDYLTPSSCWIVWNKDNGNNGYADCELAWCSFNYAVRYYKYKWHGMLQGNMMKKEERVHPTQKPVPLFEWILKNYTKTNDKILDPFCGSGPVLEACMNLNLGCLAIDISDEWVPHYRKRLRLDNSKLTDNWKTES